VQLPRIIKILDGFIPEHMRNNPADLMRAYMLIGVIFSNILTGIVTTIGLFLLLDLPQQTQVMFALVMVALLVIYSISLFAFKKTKNHRLVGNVMVSAVLALIIFAVCLTGGSQVSPIPQVLAIIPVMGFLLTGMRDGIKWLLVTLASYLGLYFLAINDIGTMQVIASASDRQTMATGLQIILFLVTGGALVVYEVISENLKHKLNEERDEFKRRASYDSLTGIPNRFEFFRRLKSGLVECHDRNQKLAVAYIDLNRFKPINDQYGHHAGDIVLQEISKRLQHALRLSDTAARLGGDEFGLVLPGIHVPDDLAVIMQKVEKAISEPVNIGETNVSISGSAGIAIYPDNGTDMDLLCRYADSSMYENKNRERPAEARFRN